MIIFVLCKLFFLALQSSQLHLVSYVHYITSRDTISPFSVLFLVSFVIYLHCLENILSCLPVFASLFVANCSISLVFANYSIYLFLANYSASLFLASFSVSIPCKLFRLSILCNLSGLSILCKLFYRAFQFPRAYFFPSLFLISYSHFVFLLCYIPRSVKVICLYLSHFKSSCHQSVSISKAHSTPSHLYSQALSIYLSIHFFHDISRFLSSLSRFNLHTQLALPRYLAQFLSFLWLCGAASASLAPPPSPCTPHRHPAGTYPHPSSFAYPRRHTFTRVSVNHVWLHGSSLHLHR